MRIMERIIATVVLGMLSASYGICAEQTGIVTLQESFTQLEKAIQNFKEQDTHPGSGWKELETFESALWRAMALDPSALAPVPVKEVPKELFAFELNQDLRQQLEELKKSPIPKQTGSEQEFTQYINTVEQIMRYRNTRQFPQARAIAKRGILDGDFNPLLSRISSRRDSIKTPAPGLSQIEDAAHAIKDQMTPKESSKRDLFLTGNQFVWITVATLFGFLIGIFGHRIHPNLFEKFVEKIDFSIPTATTHSGGVTQLDYAHWLKELEEILSRLKSSQLGHERRIEDVIQSSDKMIQQAMALANDTRIKNEVNLEYRVANLIKGLRAQADQGQKLQKGERSQINMVLEHCLKLCDAIEAGAIHYDRSRPEEPPVIKSA